MNLSKSKPKFIKGNLYIVKALDHFTRMNKSQEELYIQFIGYFIEETEYYYKFCSYYYEEYTDKKETYSNEFRLVVKCAVMKVIELPTKLTGKFEERVWNTIEMIR